jgi:DNA polymerase III delta subunit
MASKKQYGGWNTPPPVALVAGSEWFYKRREVQKAIQAARATNRSVVRVSGTDPDGLAEILDGAAFGGPALAVVSSPEDADFELLRRHAAVDDNTVSFLLYAEESFKKNSALAKFAADLPKQHLLTFDKPDKAYKHEEYAIKFAVNEAKRLNISISTDLAEALVAKVGTDLGMLHFELLKVAAYMAGLGEGPSVSATHIRATLAVLGEASVAPLSDAVGKASVRAVVREMDRLSREHPAPTSSARTLAVCGWLGGQATKWLHAAALDKDGAAETEASSRMSVPPYVYSKFILPVARRWGIKNLTRLIRTVASAETAAKSSHINPWIELETGLVSACKAAVTGG